MWFGQGNHANWDDDDNKMLDGCKDLRNGYISERLLWPEDDYIDGLRAKDHVC